MVYLSKIITKTGDKGMTSLAHGHQVPKTSAIIEAIGDVDELNCVLGVLRTMLWGYEDYNILIEELQNDLFDIGSNLSSIHVENTTASRIDESYIKKLESWIEKQNKMLTPLTSFVLPGGSPACAYCHLARAVCRRTERHCYCMSSAEGSLITIYLNRLSDLLFVMARLIAAGSETTLWLPGAGKNDDDTGTEQSLPGNAEIS